MMGINHHEAGTKWDIVACHLCGQEPRHAHCGGIEVKDIDHWSCSICRIVDQRAPGN